MKTSREDIITASLASHLTTLMAEGRSLERASAEVSILLAVASSNVKEPQGQPAEPALTLSARTRAIMAEKKIPFPQAQSEASREFRRQIVRGGR